MENVHVDVDDKWEALKAALLAHGMQLMRVLRGEGIDRHLMGLYVAAVMGGGELPPVFTDHAFKKSGMGGNFRLSTSNVGYTPQFGGFAPMTPDGYGACYALLEGRINIGVSAWRSCALTDCAKFARSIEGALRDTMAFAVAAHDPTGRHPELVVFARRRAADETRQRVLSAPSPPNRTPVIETSRQGRQMRRPRD